MDRLWQMFLRRFDLEHTFRFLKQTLGWSRPRIRTPEAADRWSWLIVAAYTQLRLARRLVAEVRRTWEPRTRDPRRLAPARVRRGSRDIPDHSAARWCSETLPAWPGPSTRFTEQAPRCRMPRREDHKTDPVITVGTQPRS